MKIIRTENGDELTLSLEGRLDTLTAPQLENENIADSVNTLTLNLAKLEYISSAGLRVVLTLHKKMSAKGGLTVSNVNEAVLDVFNATGFTDILNIV
ncbi:STAS domain-containing protein [Ruminococcus sp.]|uniref:STAS domain-containing protein n=1 Tax=Ruminococcus sp. TaxID=41978 RepID=UPI00386702A8